MAPDGDEERGAILLPALAELAKQALPPMTPARQRAGLAAVTSRLTGRGRPPRGWFRMGMLGAAFAAACGLWLVSARKTTPAPSAVTYRAEAGEILDGGYLRSLDGHGMTLRFSDGSKLALLAEARARLRQVDAQGGHLAVEQGTARIAVIPRPGAHWVVDAGPFVITVRGTVFTVGWDAHTEQLDLQMEKGLVVVTGPMLENVMAVRGGQQLAINLPKKEVVLHELEGERGAAAELARDVPAVEVTAVPSVPAAVPPVPAASLHARAVAAARPAGRTPARAPGSYGWAATLAAGGADAILGDLERLGVKRALAEASSDDLSALADAARYRRQEDLARQALLAQRTRFAGSARACDAAFLLGRLEEAHEGRGPKALAWYDQYLEGAPTGAYASEALGRKMIATQKLMGNAAARTVAQDYLARFPTGSYAGAARALRQTP